MYIIIMLLPENFSISEVMIPDLCPGVISTRLARVLESDLLGRGRVFNRPHTTRAAVDFGRL